MLITPQRNQNLSSVNLSWNGFGFEGCVALAAALLQNTSLLVLNLTSNRIHLPALHKLLDGVVRNKTLTTLHVSVYVKAGFHDTIYLMPFSSVTTGLKEENLFFVFTRFHYLFINDQSGLKAAGIAVDCSGSRE